MFPPSTLLDDSPAASSPLLEAVHHDWGPRKATAALETAVDAAGSTRPGASISQGRCTTISPIPDDLAEMAAEIRALDPKPALAFDRTPLPPVTPDILMRRHPDGDWIVELNTMPGLYPDETERPHIGKLYGAIIQTLTAAVKKK